MSVKHLMFALVFAMALASCGSNTSDSAADSNGTDTTATETTTTEETSENEASTRQPFGKRAQHFWRPRPFW